MNCLQYGSYFSNLVIVKATFNKPEWTWHLWSHPTNGNPHNNESNISTFILLYWVSLSCSSCHIYTYCDSTGSTRNSDSVKFLQPYCQVNTYQHSFYQRTITITLSCTHCPLQLWLPPAWRPSKQLSSHSCCPGPRVEGSVFYSLLMLFYHLCWILDALYHAKF